MNYPNLLFAFTEDQPTLIHGRDRWIYRAVSNLVDNAIKYGEGKLVIVTISNQKGSVNIINQIKRIKNVVTPKS
ncbi:hypothetical protein EfmAA610_31710 (plasmid) [Enterococcus faecium]|nr:hypothetical protein EfmAA610_31710 [Enterococcus faecium]